MSKRKQLHITAIKILRQCGERFRRVYFNGERRVRTKQIIGIAVDESVTMMLKNKMKTGRLPRNPRVSDNAAAVVEQMFEDHEVLFTQREQVQRIIDVRDSAVSRAVELARLYLTEVAPKLKPVAVQMPFSIKMDDFLRSRGIDYEIDLVGTIDVLESDCIRDTKTSIEEPTIDVVHDSQQLTGYALALLVLDGQIPPYVALDYLITKRGVNYSKTFESSRDMKDVQEFLMDAHWAVEQIERENFPARPNRMACNMCEFRLDCEYAVKGKKNV